MLIQVTCHFKAEENFEESYFNWQLYCDESVSDFIYYSYAYTSCEGLMSVGLL